MDAVADLADIHAQLPLLGADPRRTALAAARDAGTECTLTIFPDEGHGLTRKPNRRTTYAQIAEFLHQHLPNQPKNNQ